MVRVADPRDAEKTSMTGILFLCIHNAGRSQMAAGFARSLSDGTVKIFSGGTEPADEVNPTAIEVMQEIGIDISQNTPQLYSDELLESVDVVVTMGCGDQCTYIPGKRYLDWPLEDPRNQGLEKVREIRDEIEHRVRALLSEVQS